VCIHTYIHTYICISKTYSITYIHTCIIKYSTYIQYIFLLVENHRVDLTSSTADLYSVLGSRKITGSGLRMLARRSPFASTGPLGITTYAYIHTYIHTYIHIYIPAKHICIHTYIHRRYVITYSLIHNIYTHSHTILKHITVHTYI